MAGTAQRGTVLLDAREGFVEGFRVLFPAQDGDGAPQLGHGNGAEGPLRRPFVRDIDTV